MENLPNDFNWKTYISLNPDLENITTERIAIYHYLKYGLKENRPYKKESKKEKKEKEENNENKEKENKKESKENKKEKNENKKEKNENLDILGDFDWKKYLELNIDLSYIETEKEAIKHYLKHGKRENRSYKKNYDIPKDFDWSVYLSLNLDLYKIKTQEEAIQHYLNYGINENRPYKPIIYALPIDFNWETYISVNQDLNIKNKTEAICHYLSYGMKENRSYTKIPPDFNWETYIHYNKDVGELFKTKEEVECHYINYGVHEKRVYKEEQIFYELYYKKKINFYNDIFNICCNIIENEEKIQDTNINNTLQNKFLYKDYSYVKTNFEINNNSKIKNFMISPKYILNKKTFEHKNTPTIVDLKILNIYDSFILITDLPKDFEGGTKFFINQIIEKYKGKQNFLVVYPENDLIKFNINNDYFINLNYNKEQSLQIIENNKYKIKKIFINHTYLFPKYFVEELFNLNIEITTITHDHYLLYNKCQLMPYDVINVEPKYNINLFNNIITQNKNNLYMFKKYDNLKNIVICDLPDYKFSDEIITTDNKLIVIGIIGSISYIKGAHFVKFLIEYFKNSSYVKIVVFGKLTNSLYENCYSYNNITELNELLKLHRPNVLIETSLWSETYSYTLTLSMLTDLPILVLKKPFMNVIENRLNTYPKAFHFSTINDFLDIIIEQKQNYFKTIKPEIYFNSFWDKQFLYKDTNNYQTYFYTEQLKNIIGKNVVMITSKIYISNTKFSYTEKRSIYTPKERFEQTLNTISTIKKYVPNCFIILFDNSQFTYEEKNIFNNSVDFFINITNNEKLNYYTDTCEYKYLSDLYQQINIYYYFFKHINLSKINSLFKISGRYFINENFDYTIYNNDLNIFKKNSSVLDRDYYFTSFFKISKTYVFEYFLKLINIFYKKGDFFDMDLEVIYGKIFLQNMTLVEELGVTQVFSCWNVIDNI
jgi:hypothetical protein